MNEIITGTREGKTNEEYQEFAQKLGDRYNLSGMSNPADHAWKFEAKVTQIMGRVAIIWVTQNYHYNMETTEFSPVFGGDVYLTVFTDSGSERTTITRLLESEVVSMRKAFEIYNEVENETGDKEYAQESMNEYVEKTSNEVWNNWWKNQIDLLNVYPQYYSG